MSETAQAIDATGGGTILDDFGANVITAGAAAATIAAGLGTDTILAGIGALVVDAYGDLLLTDDNPNPVVILAGAGTLDFIPGSGASTVTGAAGSILVEAGDPIFGTLAFTAGTGASTLTGALEGTTITGGTGTVAFTQRGLATVTAGAGTITITADGNLLEVDRPDHLQSLAWAPDTGDVLAVVAGLNGITTVTDQTSGAVTLLKPSGIVYVRQVNGGLVADAPGDNVLDFGPQAATLTASLGTDLITGGSGALLVDATGNTRAMTINAAGGGLVVRPGGAALHLLGGAGPVEIDHADVGASLVFTGSTGDATITGTAGGTTIAGGAGRTTLAQNGPTSVSAGAGRITIVADGTPLTITGADAAERFVWPATHHTLALTTDAHAVTTVTDGTTGLAAVLANGLATINAPLGGQIGDLPGRTYISLTSGASTVSATRGTDTVQAGAGPILVTAAGNANPVLARGGAGTMTFVPGPAHDTVVGTVGDVIVAAGDPLASLTFQAGSGNATIAGAAVGTEVFGGRGNISLAQHGATTLHGGTGTATVVTDGTPFTVWGNGVQQQRVWTGAPGDTVTVALNVSGLTTAQDLQTGVTYTFGDSGITSSGGGDQRDVLLSGEAGSPYYGVLRAQLDALLGLGGVLSYIQPTQAVPLGGTPALLVGALTPAPITVPGGVPVVRDKVPGSVVYGNGRAGQFVTATAGFTYYALGGSGAVIADDAQAGGAAPASHIVLAASGGGDFVVATGSGDDTVEASSGNVSIDAGGGRNLLWLGSGRAQVISEGADSIASGAGPTTVRATGPSAVIWGGSSSLTFFGGAGAATVISSTGHPDLTGGSGPALFWGSGSGGSVMRAGSGGATIVGGGGGNAIYAGGGGDELLVAGTGGSSLIGGDATGSNIYWGSNGSDVIAADRGSDLIITGAGSDTVGGSGAGGNATIFGGGGGNLYQGGAGNTQIIAGWGAPDRFSFLRGGTVGTTLIWGFRDTVDHIVLGQYAAGEAAAAIAGARPYGFGSEVDLSDGTRILFGDLTRLSPSSFQ